MEERKENTHQRQGREVSYKCPYCDVPMVDNGIRMYCKKCGLTAVEVITDTSQNGDENAKQNLE